MPARFPPVRSSSDGGPSLCGWRVSVKRSRPLRYASVPVATVFVTGVLWWWLSSRARLDGPESMGLAGLCFGVAALLLAALGAYVLGDRMERLAREPRLRLRWHQDPDSQDRATGAPLRLSRGGTLAHVLVARDRDVWLHLPFAVENQGLGATERYRLELHVPPSLNRRASPSQEQPSVALSRSPHDREAGVWRMEWAVDRPNGCRFVFDSEDARTVYPGWPEPHGRLDIRVPRANPIPVGRYEVIVRIAADGMTMHEERLGVLVGAVGREDGNVGLASQSSTQSR